MASPENERVRDIWVKLGESLLPPAEIPDWRTGFEEMTSGFPVVEGTTFEEVDAGGCPALLVTAPGASDAATVMWTHSGGYVFGSAKSYRAYGSALSAASGAQVLLLDYRLAPESTFPGATDDANGAYRWLLEQGRAPGSVVVGGDSAGGGLALATLLRIVDEGLPTPGAGIAVSPVGDLTCSGASMQERAHLDPVASKDVLLALGGMYAGAAEPTHRHLSPALADLTGLPPLLVLVGTEEVLHDDALRVVAGAEKAGVDVELVVGEGMFHIWPLFHGILPEGQAGMQTMGAFVRTRLGL